MRYLVTASEMRRFDENTIEKIGIPACVLMERAALAAAELTAYAMTPSDLLGRLPAAFKELEE